MNVVTKNVALPDGRVILSSRVGGGRIYNIYTYSNTLEGAGEWSTSVKSIKIGFQSTTPLLIDELYLK